MSSFRTKFFFEITITLFSLRRHFGCDLRASSWTPLTYVLFFTNRQCWCTKCVRLVDNTIKFKAQRYENDDVFLDSSEDEVKKTFDQQSDLCKIQKLVNQLPTDFRNAVFKQNNKKSEDDLFLNELKKIKRNYSDENNNILKKIENRLSSCGSFRITDTFVKEKRMLFNSNTCKTADSLRVQLPSSSK